MIKLGIQICARGLFSHSGGSSVKDVVKLERILPNVKQVIRNMSFFNTETAEQLWKSATTVSNAGLKRGRGRGTDRRIKKNLNIGQKMGFGKKRIIWPGLNTPVIQSKTLISIRELGKKEMLASDASKEGSPEKLRFEKPHPLLRGWTSKSMTGRKLGSPEPRGDETYEAFDSIVVKLEIRLTPTGNLGKKRMCVAMVLTGNGNGLIGVGEGKSLNSKLAIRKATNQAIHRLLQVDLMDPRTVNHDFFSQYGNTKVIAFKKPSGYGLKCQRAIKACCELLGIHDLAVQVKGPVNMKHLLRAFFLGLLRQKTYQELADEKKLHLVEVRRDRLDFPVLLASPKTCLSDEEAQKNPVIFNEYIMGNRFLAPFIRKVPFYENLPSWNTYLKRTLSKRNEKRVRDELLVEYGELRSHLTDAYPECVDSTISEKKEQEV